MLFRLDQCNEAHLLGPESSSMGPAVLRVVLSAAAVRASPRRGHDPRSCRWLYQNPRNRGGVSRKDCVRPVTTGPLGVSRKDCVRPVTTGPLGRSPAVEYAGPR